MNGPLVSVCIPTRNGAKYLIEALASIKHQTYKNIEVVISDDNSKDDTLEIVQKFRIEADCPVSVHHHSPSGIGANWNNCIKKSRGEYIKFLFQDDILYSGCVEEMMKVFNSEPNIGLVASKRKFIVEGSPNNTVTEWISKYKDLQENLDLPKLGLNVLDQKLFKHDRFLEFPENKVGEPTAVMFRRSVLDKTGYFREDFEQILDCEFYYRILKKFRIAIINKELVGFRLHPGQTTNVNRHRPINDYKKFDRIIYDEFFWFLNTSQQKLFFLKFNPICRAIRKIYHAGKIRN